MYVNMGVELTTALEVVVSNLISYGIFEPRISTLTALLRDRYIDPLLTGNSTLTAQATLSIVNTPQSQPPETVFRHLISLVTFVGTSFPQSILSTLIPDFLP